MIKLDRIFHAGEPRTYNLVFTGNSGEEQLTIIASVGQHQKFATIVCTTQIDGGCRMVYGGDVPIREFRDSMKQICESWLLGTIRPVSSADQKQVVEDLKRMDKAVCYKYELDGII